MRTIMRVAWGFVLLSVLSGALTAYPAQSAPGQDLAPDIEADGDVITASDGEGGHLSTRDIILIVIIVFAVIGLIAVL